MRVDAKICNKILANQIQKYFKRITEYDQMGHSLGMQSWFNILNLTNVIYHINKQKTPTIQSSQ